MTSLVGVSTSVHRPCSSALVTSWLNCPCKKLSASSPRTVIRDQSKRVSGSRAVARVTDHYSMRQRETTRTLKGPVVSLQNELNTITSSMSELSVRITALVELEGASMQSEVYSELVAAERSIGTLLRRLTRVATRIQ